MVNVKIYRLRCAMSVSPFIKNMKSSSKETKDIIQVLCNIFEETKIQESFIFNKDILTSLKTFQ